MQRGRLFLFWKRAFVNGALLLVNTFAMQKDKIVKASQLWSRRDVTKTGNGERGAGSGERGTEVWERVVSGNLHKNPIWPMIENRRNKLNR